MVNDNFISGSIPDVFSEYKRLDFFDISNALLTGPIPETLFDIPSLRLVYMSNNTLNGTIPATFSKPPLLRDLYLNGNKLSGTVPSIEPGQLPDFNEFLFHFNNITGTIPAALCDLRTNNGNLDDLFADCGGLNPEIVCEFPTCCNRCFEGAANARRRR